MTDYRYTLAELRLLWIEYHNSVHRPGSIVPCDACPGNECYTDAFFDWLERKELKKTEADKRIANIRRRMNSKETDNAGSE